LICFSTPFANLYPYIFSGSKILLITNDLQLPLGRISVDAQFVIALLIQKNLLPYPKIPRRVPHFHQEQTLAGSRKIGAGAISPFYNSTKIFQRGLAFAYI
jgi:hypothetical protein